MMSLRSDLEHEITAADPRGPAGLIDELVRIGRAVAVVLGRDLVEDCHMPAMSMGFDPPRPMLWCTAAHQSHTSLCTGPTTRASMLPAS